MRSVLQIRDILGKEYRVCKNSSCVECVGSQRSTPHLAFQNQLGTRCEHKLRAYILIKAPIHS